MIDKVFIDTNIFVYAFLNNCEDKKSHLKHLKAKEFLQSFKDNQKVIISTQVCNEYYSALLKNKIPNDEIQNSLKELMDAIEVAPITTATILVCFDLKNRYNYSYWDSLILSSVLENSCTTLYSEDMQHKQIVENQIKIINPFL